MNEQGDLFRDDTLREKLRGRQPLDPERQTKLEAKFREWLATGDGQACLNEATRRALGLKSRGFRHYSMDAIWHSIRFDRAMAVGPDEDGFKVNDHHTAYMAREVMRVEPMLAGFFETRELTSI